MRWVSQDIEMYIKSKEYVDTAIMLLLPVSFDKDMKQTASMSEFISLLSFQIERQFRGRVLMLPSHSYLKSLNADKLVNDVKEWEENLFAEGFKNIFYLTSDSFWKSFENQLQGSLIWLPSLPLENFDESTRNSILDDQVKQLVSLFLQKWQKEG